MNIETFAVWKFKTIEGILKNFYSGDFTTSKYKNGDDTFEIKYDIKNCMARIEPGCFKFHPKVCHFKDLPETLKSMGVYELLDESETNKSAWIPFTEVTF